MKARIYAVLVGCALLGVVRPAHAQASRWHAADVVRLARRHAPEVQASRRRVELAEAVRSATGRPPDPSLTWSREETFPDSQANNQDIFLLTWPLDLSGRRGARRALAHAEVSSQRATATATERRVILRALGDFYTTIALQRSAEALQAHVEALDEVERVLAQREAAGTASGYARARLSVEAELVRSKLASRRAAAERSRRALAARMDPELRKAPRMDGSLDTRAPAATELLVERALAEHPALTSRRAVEQAARRAKDAADTAWLPTVSLMGGYKVARTTETEHGYAAGVGVDLPFFSQDEGLQARAQARLGLARAESQALRRRLRTRIVEARSRLRDARKELARFEKATSGDVETLLHGAQVSYREGRRPLLEVLDAQRAASKTRLRRIELALEAKRAEVELRGLTTGWR